MPIPDYQTLMRPVLRLAAEKERPIRECIVIVADEFDLWLIPLTPADQHLVGGGFEGEAEAEETLERPGGVAPTVEAEHELVEVGLEVRRP